MLAYVGLRALVANGPTGLPRFEQIAVHPPVLAFTVAVSLASTLLFGSITALKHAWHVNVPAISAARGSSASRARSRTRNALVVVQVALALVLLVSSALMIRTFQALRVIDPGFSEPATIQTARIWIPTAEFPNREQVMRMEHEVLDRIASLPGITAVGFADTVPMESAGMGMAIAVEGEPPAAAQRPLTNIKFVSPGYFATMGTKMIAGREVTWSDIETGGHVAVISERFARSLAPEPAGAVGERVRFDGFAQDAWREVIGVVQNIHETGLYEAPSAWCTGPRLPRTCSICPRTERRP